MRRRPLAALSRTLILLSILAGLWSLVEALTAALGRGAGRIEDALGLDAAVVAVILLAGAAALLRPLWLAWERGRRGLADAGWTPLRHLFEILFVAAVVFLLALQPFRPEVFVVVRGLCAAFWGFVLSLPPLDRFPKLRRVARAIDLGVFNLALFVVLAEGTLHLASRISASPLLAEPGEPAVRSVWRMKEKMHPGHYRFGFRVNSQGYYDSEFLPRGDHPIVAMIGDSFSAGIVPHSFHFSTVCERRLEGAEVYNYGLPATGPAEYLHLLETEVLPVDPDVVAVNVFVGNDVREALERMHPDPTLRTWLSLNSLLLYQIPRRWLLLRSAQGEADADTPVAALPGESDDRPLTTLEEMTAAYPWLADPSLEEPTFYVPEAFYQVTERRIGRLCNPKNEDSYAAIFEALQRMRDLAEDRPFVVQLLPDEFQVSDELWSTVRPRFRGQKLDRDRPQKVLREWLTAQGIPYFDLLPELRQRCHDTPDGHCYHLRNTHFNARGNRLVGRAMAEFLELFLAEAARRRSSTSGSG